ncbi:hypothetical protein RBS60_08170 [Sinomonas sp. ASV486]|uniref:hypothetical protein n=1 Tax=Sinomonas sp. ASV486 TaxID=3051170 RepID=UPI0027DBD452|nr:hypothetical protein [Sinomonas sp. ASV486]MDQ4490176.1 hypothetical protein [Sinomonas sp. ASV486]
MTGEAPGTEGRGGGDFIEDVIPGSGDAAYFSERSTPRTADTLDVRRSKAHPASMRRSLALPIMWFLLGSYGVTMGVFLVARFIPHDPALFGSADLSAAIAGVSGLQGLAAAVVGFYFGSKQDDDKM